MALESVRFHSPQARRWRRAASWMGRLNLLLALAVLAIAVALVRGGFRA
jgi:hypothetical protein